jgi:Ca2+-binding RTX toxin-like protein
MTVTVKRVMMVLALVALLVPFVVGVAFAGGALIRCTTVPCTATGDSDLIYERVGNGKNDTIVMKGGSDLVRANAYTNDTDVVRGGTGNDKINVADGDNLDTASGGPGRDHCIVDVRAEAGSGCVLVTLR